MDIEIDHAFFDYFGAPAACIGQVPPTDFEIFSLNMQQKIARPSLTKVQYHKEVKKVAIAAGGGDIPDLLQAAHDFGCDTFLTGTVEHRWALEGVQMNNRAFHKHNETLQLNLIGGTHFGTERPAMIHVADYFKLQCVPVQYIEDEVLLNAV